MPAAFHATPRGCNAKHEERNRAMIELYKKYRVSRADIAERFALGIDRINAIIDQDLDAVRERKTYRRKCLRCEKEFDTTQFVFRCKNCRNATAGI